MGSGLDDDPDAEAETETGMHLVLGRGDDCGRRHWQEEDPEESWSMSDSLLQLEAGCGGGGGGGLVADIEAVSISDCSVQFKGAVIKLCPDTLLALMPGFSAGSVSFEEAAGLHPREFFIQHHTAVPAANKQVKVNSITPKKLRDLCKQRYHFFYERSNQSKVPWKFLSVVYAEYAGTKVDWADAMCKRIIHALDGLLTGKLRKLHNEKLVLQYLTHMTTTSFAPIIIGPGDNNSQQQQQAATREDPEEDVPLQQLALPSSSTYHHMHHGHYMMVDDLLELDDDLDCLITLDDHLDNNLQPYASSGPPPDHGAAFNFHDYHAAAASGAAGSDTHISFV